ncbi:MAG: HAD family phosphatase [Trichodesmium sp. St18_bin1]|jgi:haloacid dehalogenase superfamily, subfamily IA, variant 3 with third motif having DD or ED|nr:HAD family phosphatase [Trichodesmium sp. St18_bin1]MDE5119521.1 HAD family phosphatase [Trichodesmium sp. St19_bin1]
MTLKAVLFDFNGVIVNDELLHEQLIEQVLLEENLLLKPGEYHEFCLGKSDRACLKDILIQRGRCVNEGYLEQLIKSKTLAYQKQLENIEELPIYSDTVDFIAQVSRAELKMAVVTGAIRTEVELVLNKANLANYFQVIVGGDNVKESKPKPDAYLLAVDILNQKCQGINLKPSECLVIEDTFPGIEAAKLAGMSVVGVAHTYPFHILQRLANWCVDDLSDLELDRVQKVYQEVV